VPRIGLRAIEAAVEAQCNRRTLGIEDIAAYLARQVADRTFVLYTRHLALRSAGADS
jgi:hypothetical protein